MAIIAISGPPGAGKSTLAKKLALALDFENIDIGAIFRKLAEESGCELVRFYKSLKHDPDMEREVDQKQADIMREKDNCIIQGRMAPFFESSFQKINILLKAEEVERARRQMNRPENQGKTFEEVLKLSRERLKEERQHYRQLYHRDDHLNERHFNIVINTTGLTKEQVFAIAYMDIKTAIK